MQGQDPHTKGTPNDHALRTYNLKAHWRTGKPLLGYIYIALCSLLHAPICFPKLVEPLVTRKRRKGKHHHKRTNQTTTVHNNPFSTEFSSAHSELDYKCKCKNLQNKANPQHLIHLYNLVTQANTTRGNTPETPACHNTSRNTTQYPVQHTTIPPLLPSMSIPLTQQINPTSPNPPHLAQPNQHPSSEGNTLSRNANRYKCRNQVRIAKHSSGHISPHTTFIAQLITVKSLDNASSKIHQDTHITNPLSS